VHIKKAVGYKNVFKNVVTNGLFKCLNARKAIDLETLLFLSQVRLPIPPQRPDIYGSGA
jgi:hypothetical protein